MGGTDLFASNVISVFEKILLQIIAFDELKTDFKSPIDQCNPAHAVSSVLLFYSNLVLIIMLNCQQKYGFESGLPKSEFYFNM